MSGNVGGHLPTVALGVAIATALTGAGTGWPVPACAADGLWIGARSHFVLLHAEQRRTGLDDLDFFAGLMGGIDRGRWSAEVDLVEGSAVQRLQIDEVADPRLRIWSLDAGVRARPHPRWPVTAGARAGLWRFDYRDESVVLAFPGLEPTLVRFEDFTQPVLALTGGLEFAPYSFLGLTVDAGLMGLRLNETRIDGNTTSVTPRWRTSPTVAVGARIVGAGPR